MRKVIAVFGCSRKYFLQKVEEDFIMVNKAQAVAIKGEFDYKHFSNPEQLKGYKLHDYEIWKETNYIKDISEFEKEAQMRIARNLK